MRLLSIDCESSGPCPTRGDLISFGAVVVEPELSRRFRSPDMKPTCAHFDPGAYNAIGITRRQHEAYTATTAQAFEPFARWIASLGSDRLTMVSDNPAFDWQWINWGFHTVLGRNPLGFSARRIGDIWAGHNGNLRDTTSWKEWRRTPHTHNPLDDAVGNAEALMTIIGKMAK
jgi:hypothetical protein